MPAKLFEPGGRLEKIELANGRPNLTLAYWHAEDIGQFTADLGVLAETGRLMIRPKPQLLAFSPPDEHGNRTWQMLDVDQDSHPAEWLCPGEDLQAALPLKSGPPADRAETELAKITMPYLQGIPMGLLGKVLDDEQQYLGELRLTLKRLLKEVHADPSRAAEIVNDTVQPAIDRLNRRFRQIYSLHSVRTAGVTIAGAAVTLAAFATGGIVGVIAALLGAGALREITEFKKALNEARESPYYLLWRLSNEQAN